MYAAHSAPAISANTTPEPIQAVRPPRVSARIPGAANSTHTASSRRREPPTATASGPTNSIVTAIPSGIR